MSRFRLLVARKASQMQKKSCSRFLKVHVKLQKSKFFFYFEREAVVRAKLDSSFDHRAEVLRVSSCCSGGRVANLDRGVLV